MSTSAPCVGQVATFRGRWPDATEFRIRDRVDWAAIVRAGLVIVDFGGGWLSVRDERERARPTAAQLVALRLAATGPIRFFRGGWYSTEALAGSLCDPRADHRTFTAAHTSIRAIVACVERGWLSHGPPVSDVYESRWTLTAAGSAVLAFVDPTVVPEPTP